MGAGIARQIASMYPKADQVDKESHLPPKKRLGKFTFTQEGETTIVNLYGQYEYGRGTKTNYTSLEEAIDTFFSMAIYNNKIDLSKVGVPYNMGCGLAGGDWDKVKAILERQSSKHNIDIYTYKL